MKHNRFLFIIALKIKTLQKTSDDWHNKKEKKLFSSDFYFFFTLMRDILIDLLTQLLFIYKLLHYKMQQTEIYNIILCQGLQQE